MDLTVQPDLIGGVGLSDVVNLFISQYEAATGKTLQPAQAERLLINSGAYILYTEGSLRIQSAGVQNLPQFATYPILDYLAAPFGVTRLPAAAAQCTVVFTLVAGHGDLVIPKGTRVQSQDGLATFATQGDIPVAAGVNTVASILICDTVGVAGNGYVAGKISVILDPQAYLSAAANQDETDIGADVESDDHMRERLYQSPNSFTTAGTDDSYKYWAKTASSLILDVGIDNGTGGVVNLYPLVAGGVTPDEILTAVQTICSPKNRRPTSDTVTAHSPAIINYSLNISVVAYAYVSDTGALIAQVVQAVSSLAMANSKQLGIDIILSQYIAAASLTGVAKVSITNMTDDIVVNNTSAAVCTGVNVSLTGINNDKQ